MEATAFRSSNVEIYKAAATRRGLGLSDWLREAADTALRSEGFSTASAERQYALVSGGELVTSPRGRQVVTFRPFPITAANLWEGFSSEAAWLPIVDRYPEDFDKAKHLLQAPLPLSVDAEAGIVVRFYPIVPKAEVA